MKFTSLLTNLILENSRFQVLYDKMVKPAKGQEGDARKPKGLMDFETLKAIIFADPTTRIPEGLGDIDTISVNDMEKVKVGKYSQWLLKNFVMPTFNDERANIEKAPRNTKERRMSIKDCLLRTCSKLRRTLKNMKGLKTNSLKTREISTN